MTELNRRAWLTAAAAMAGAALLRAREAAAQAYPQRPVRLIVPFALGSETRGSIVSPSTVCGATGLRPTFGRVSVDFTADQPGLTLFHCHIQQHMDFGFKALLRYT